MWQEGLEEAKISECWRKQFWNANFIPAIELDTLNDQSALDSCFLELKSIHVVNKFGDKHWETYNIEEMGVPLNYHSNSRRDQKKLCIILWRTSLKLLFLDA